MKAQPNDMTGNKAMAPSPAPDDEELIAAHDYDHWLAQNCFSARWARFWFSPSRTVWLNTPARRLVKALTLKPADKVLDLGCGYAGLLIYLSRKVRFTQTLEGLDCSPLMIERARKEIRSRGLEAQVHVQQGRATQLPYPDSTFDVLLCTYVIKHLSDPLFREMLREVLRVLKPGGCFCLWEAAPSRYKFMQVWNMRLLRIGMSAVWLRSAEHVRAFLEAAGFTGIRPYGQGHYYYYYPPLLRTGFIAFRPQAAS
jgi:ubiquinone/menaquinone biosynthesis C-methylase UbiE